MPELTVVGSVALDTIETPTGRAEETLGGSATYISAAGSLFTRVHMVGVVGEDFPAHKVEFLRNRGVDLEGLESRPGVTFRWYGRYHQNMNRRDTVSVEMGVFEKFNPRLTEAAAQAGVLMLANIDPDLQESVLKQMQGPTFVAYDTMNHWIEKRRSEVERMVRKVDMVFLNDEELLLLMGGDNIVAAAKHLLHSGPSYVVVKKGEHGAMLFSAGRPPFLCPAFPVEKPVDPTGAGDSFAGGILGYLAATGDITPYNIRQAVVYGTIVASFTVEDFGVRRLERLNAEEVEERYRQFRSMVEF